MVAAVGGTGRSPSWRVSSAFIRTGSTTGRSSCWTGRRAFSKAAVARAHVGKRSLEKRCPSDGGPRVRIHLPPALSPLRTSFSGGKRGKVRGDDKGRSQGGEYLKRNRWFESGSLQRRVSCEPDVLLRWDARGTITSP